MKTRAASVKTRSGQTSRKPATKDVAKVQIQDENKKSQIIKKVVEATRTSLRNRLALTESPKKQTSKNAMNLQEEVDKTKSLKQTNVKNITVETEGKSPAMNQQNTENNDYNQPRTSNRCSDRLLKASISPIKEKQKISTRRSSRMESFTNVDRALNKSPKKQTPKNGEPPSQESSKNAKNLQEETDKTQSLKETNVKSITVEIEGKSPAMNQQNTENNDYNQPRTSNRCSDRLSKASISPIKEKQKISTRRSSRMESFTNVDGALNESPKKQTLKNAEPQSQRSSKNAKKLPKVLTETNVKNITIETEEKSPTKNEKITENNDNQSGTFKRCSVPLVRISISPIKEKQKITTRRSSRMESFTLFDGIGTSTPVINKKLPNEEEKPLEKPKVLVKKPKKSPTKKVQFENVYIKNLRPRRPNKKYKDSLSLQIESEKSEVEDSDNNNAQVKEHVLVYKQHVKDVQKKKKDVYEFELSEKSQSDSDNEYDKDMVQELKFIKKLEKKQQVKQLAKAKLLKKAALKTTQSKVKKDLVTKKPDLIETQNINENVKNVKATNTNLPKVKIISDVRFKLPIITHKSSRITKNPQELDSVAANNEEEVNANLNELQDEILQIENSFLDSEPIIDIISLRDKRVFDRPNANSTMLVPSCSSPWRPCMQYRNALLIQTKKSSLPAVDQDLLLNATIVERHSHSTSIRSNVSNSNLEQEQEAKKPNTDLKTHLKTKTKQTSILEFIPNANYTETQRDISKENLNCTLFDENLLLSPVKRTSSRIINLRNRSQSPDKSNFQRVLQDRTNISHVVNTPERESTDVDFFALSANVQRVEMGKPTRFNLRSRSPNVHVKNAKNFEQDQEQQEVENNDKDDEEEDEQEKSTVFQSPVSQSHTHTDADDVNLDKNSENAAEVVGIFEDFHDHELNTTLRSLPSFTYERKRKRARHASHKHDDEDEDYEDNSYDEVTKKKKRRKKKNEMTKKEQDEFNEWAKMFNAQIAEVEKTILEVD